MALFRAHAPLLTIACAPSGYGKSVLAAQFALCGAFDDVVWVDLQELDVSEDSAICALGASLVRRGTGPLARDSALSELGVISAEARLAFDQEMSRLHNLQVCVVLDNGGTAVDLPGLVRLAELIARRTAAGSRLLITCRRAVVEGLDCSRLWTIDHGDLRFQRHEVEALLEVCGEGTSPCASLILARSGGQAALVSLMIRHPAAAVECAEAQDLLWYTDHLLWQMPDWMFELMYCAALTGDGPIDDLAESAGHAVGALDWPALCSAMPLFSASSGSTWSPARFQVHASLARVACRQSSSRLSPDRKVTLRGRTLGALDARGAYERMARVLMTDGNAQEALEWCEAAGEGMLRAVGPAIMQRCLCQVPLRVLAGRPRALLLNAAILRQLERTDEALRSASAAQALASHADDRATAVAASLLTARLTIDAGELVRARDILHHLDSGVPGVLAPSQESLVQAYLAVADAVKGDIEIARVRTARVRTLLHGLDVGSDEAVNAANSVGSIDGLCCGDWEAAARAIGAVAARSDLSPVQRLLVRANHAAAILEMGSMEDAWELASDVGREAERAGLSQLQAYALSTQFGVEYARDSADAGAVLFDRAAEVLSTFADTVGLSLVCAHAAAGERAAGKTSRSLALGERSLSALGSRGDAVSLLAASARIEIAASLLALGDVRGSSALIKDVLGEGLSSHALAHHLRIDLLRAEIDLRNGRHAQAIERLAPHAGYVRTGSMNYQVAMHLRAFPAALGVLAAAVGVDMLPARLLGLLPDETCRNALSLASSWLPAEVSAGLAERHSGLLPMRAVTEQPALAVHAPAAVEPLCYVRLFGGLEVSSEHGRIDETAWRKRKSRAILVMLVLERGRDVPRDLILERLWPDMDDSHARNNFYVMWSTLRRMLSFDGPSQQHAGRFIQHVGGLCRVTDCVRSDLDEFYERLESLRQAVVSGDCGRTAFAARELMDLYRGDLLPGDVYDDWVGEVRDHVKHGFCDGLLAAARVAEAAGEHSLALDFARRASGIDPWREDVYQIMMRCQMNAGQRSRAIEAYLACRTRLVDDLGIDPSAETTMIYQAVLAMEGAEAEYRGCPTHG